MIKNVEEMIYNQVEKEKYFSSGVPFSKYQKVYLSTNENINEYLNLCNFKGKNNALSVMASGDHVFNLINKNILNIDTFDTNSLTEYYVLGLKRAMVLKYDYKDYLETYSKITNEFISLEELTTILSDLLPYMDEKHKKFWSNIIQYNYKLSKNKKTKINLIYMLFININNVDNIIKNNNYLLNEIEYNKLKNNLTKANILFKNINAKNLDINFNKKYDFILLSNILDYFSKYYDYDFSYENLDEYKKSIYKILNKDGIVFLNYIIKYSTNSFTRNYVIKGSNIKTSDLTDEEVLKIKSFNEPICYDAILLSKKY